MDMQLGQHHSKAAPAPAARGHAMSGLFQQFTDPAMEERFLASILPENRWRLTVLLAISAMLAGGGVLARQIGLFSGAQSFNLWPAYAHLAIAALAGVALTRLRDVRGTEYVAICFGIAYIAARCYSTIAQPALMQSSAAATMGSIVLLYMGLPVRPALLLPLMLGGSAAMAGCWVWLLPATTSVTAAHMLEWCALCNFVLAVNTRLLRYAVRRQWAQAETLRTLSAQDGLTGVANRRSYEAALQREWLRCQGLAAPVSLIMLDIDFFKLLNDSQGYAAGDASLRELACVLEGALDHPGQMLARTAGDEFVILLPEMRETEARMVARRVVQSVEAAGLPHPCSPLGPSLTLSLGIATARPAEGFAAWELTALADRLVYAAKREGRNRLRQESLGVEGPPPPEGRLDAAGRSIALN